MFKVENPFDYNNAHEADVSRHMSLPFFEHDVEQDYGIEKRTSVSLMKANTEASVIDKPHNFNMSFKILTESDPKFEGVTEKRVIYDLRLVKNEIMVEITKDSHVSINLISDSKVEV